MNSVALRREVNLPFAAAGVFYALAIFGTIMPMTTQVAGGARRTPAP